MKHEGIKHVTLALTLALSAVSCGSGSTNLAEGGIGGTGISMGTVSAIGSIWVNGVEYDTTEATIIFADEGRQEVDTSGTAGGSTLLPGMVVTVEGTINGVQGSATTVTYADILEGPLNGDPDPIANTFLVLGQTVIVDNKTKFKDGGPADISGLADNNVVEVSGFRDGSGNIRATYIEKKADSLVSGVVIELKGIISAVGTDTISIGSQVVNTGTAKRSGFSVEPAVNDFVEARGLSFNAGGELIATDLELKSSVLDTKDQKIAELEGIVTDTGLQNSEFTLGGQRVSFNPQTTVFNGGLQTDILVGNKLEVEGSLKDGVLIADEVTFEDSIELEANIKAGGIDQVNKTVTLDGLDLTVTFDETLTALEGVTTFGDLIDGQHLEILARETSTGLTATRIKVLAFPPGDTKVTLYGPVDSVDRTAMTVTVLNILAENINEFEIESLDTKPGEAIFFSIVKENDLVELEGQWSGGLLSWDSIELDD